MKNVKNYIEIVLLIILVGCIYNGECKLLNDLMNNTVGKLSLLSLVVLILVYFGKTAGVLAACIYVFILHVNRKEGFEGLSLEVNTKEKKNKKKGKWEKENEDDEDKEGFSIKIGSDSKDEDDDKEDKKDKKDKDDKEGYWEKRNKEGFDDDIEGMKNTISKLVKKVKKLEKKKKEGFANLRQNRRLKINNISVLNTTDLDRTIKKDSEVRTLNSTI
tara:strand:- start:19758 stop:20408 length:651 start_codon:yes stop_codon:yes gene_type:complete